MRVWGLRGAVESERCGVSSGGCEVEGRGFGGLSGSPVATPRHPHVLAGRTSRLIFKGQVESLRLRVEDLVFF